MKKIITKQELLKQLELLLPDFEIIGTQDLAGRGIFYGIVKDETFLTTETSQGRVLSPPTSLADEVSCEALKNAQGLYLGEGFSVEPLKKFFLKPSEIISRCQYKNRENVLEEAELPQNKRIIIGARPCETRGLELLDKVYDSQYQDKFYLHNRKRTTIIGLSCMSPDRACFCTSIGGSNLESRGMDAILFPIEGEKFILEAVTEKGSQILGSLGRELSNEEIESWDRGKEKRKGLVKTKIKVTQDLDKIFHHPYWEKVSHSCLSCGICTFLCPTCHCFDLVDEERQKLRCYDGCAFPDFTLEASGGNPRPTKKERFRQRVFHKFDYFRKNFGENLCVACGRCIRHCPVKIDIADIVDKAPWD